MVFKFNVFKYIPIKSLNKTIEFSPLTVIIIVSSNVLNE